MAALRVFAPASMGNISVGFDVLGGALAPIDGSLLGDCVSIEQIEQGIEVSTIGTFANKLPSDPKQNIVYDCAVAYQAQLKANNIEFKGLKIVLEKLLPVGSGLGSSAASVVAAFYALNEFYHQALSKHQLLLLMGQLEGQISGSVHYDNVAPSYLGGLQLMIDQPGQQCSEIPSFDAWYWGVAYSGMSVSTAESRRIMPTEVPLATALKFGQNLATFIDASHKGNQALAAQVLVDVIAEPVRGAIIPGFNDAKQAMLELGALASGISGSGPTLFAVTDDLAKAQQLENYLKQHYLQTDEGFSHICKIDTQGARREALRGTV